MSYLSDLPWLRVCCERSLLDKIFAYLTNVPGNFTGFRLGGIFVCFERTRPISSPRLGMLLFGRAHWNQSLRDLTNLPSGAFEGMRFVCA